MTSYRFESLTEGRQGKKEPQRNVATDWLAGWLAGRLAL